MAACVRHCGGGPKRADWEQRACVRFAHRHLFVIFLSETDQSKSTLCDDKCFAIGQLVSQKGGVVLFDVLSSVVGHYNPLAIYLRLL